MWILSNAEKFPKINCTRDIDTKEKTTKKNYLQPKLGRQVEH